MPGKCLESSCDKASWWLPGYLMVPHHLRNRRNATKWRWSELPFFHFRDFSTHNSHQFSPYVGSTSQTNWWELSDFNLSQTTSQKKELRPFFFCLRSFFGWRFWQPPGFLRFSLVQVKPGQMLKGSSSTWKPHLTMLLRTNFGEKKEIGQHWSLDYNNMTLIYGMFCCNTLTPFKSI